MSKNAIKRIIQRDIKSIQEKKLNELGIYIDFNEGNMLEATAMIIGPNDTLYENGILFFKIKFPDNYPYSPPHILYVSRGSNRIHPNLYTGGAKDNYLGKVCLSILGTWSGPQWTTIMDIGSVLITIQSLLDNNPLDHEPGFSGKLSDNHKNYSKVVSYEKYRTLIIKNIFDTPTEFMCFKDIINTHYEEKKDKIYSSIKKNKNSTIILPIYRINQFLNYTALISQLKI
jgi:ubiquitin-protein ligase